MLGEGSEWFGYLESLPRDPVDLALFWGNDATLEGDSNSSMRRWIGVADSQDLRLLDGKEAMLWLTGTEVETEFLRSTKDGQPIIVSEEYNLVIASLTSLRSKSLITSTLSRTLCGLDFQATIRPLLLPWQDFYMLTRLSHLVPFS